MKYVFLLNMGGANNLDECYLFLKNMFNDKYILGIKSELLRRFVAMLISKSRVSTMRANYRKIGGKSPLSAIEQRLCHKLNAMQDEYHFDFISTYVPPFARDVLGRYSFGADDEIVVLPLYPHHSSTTICSSVDDFMSAFRDISASISAKSPTNEILSPKICKEFYTHPSYNKIITNTVLSAPRTDVLIISAHSLPESIIKKGDKYESHIKAHFELIKSAASAHYADVRLAYQSRLGPIKWLGPALSDMISSLAGKSILIYPVSFCIDCSETLVELDIEYREQYEQACKAANLEPKHYQVCACPNDSDDFCEFLLEYASSCQYQ